MAVCGAEHPDHPGVHCGFAGDGPHGFHRPPPGSEAPLWPNPDDMPAVVPPRQQGRKEQPRDKNGRTIAQAAQALSKRLKAIGATAYVREHAHETEVEAAAAAKVSSEVQRDRVHALLVRMGDAGATDWEMQEWLGLHHNTQTPRRLELVENGLVVDSGFRRPTNTGRQAIVWMAVRVESETT